MVLIDLKLLEDVPLKLAQDPLRHLVVPKKNIENHKTQNEFCFFFSIFQIKPEKLNKPHLSKHKFVNFDSLQALLGQLSTYGLIRLR